ALAALVGGVLLAWASWRWRRPLGKALPRLAALGVVVIALLAYRPPAHRVEQCHGAECGYPPPPPPTTLAAVRDDLSHWRCSSAHEIGRGPGDYGPLEARLGVD